jgi:hypothetical protein
MQFAGGEALLAICIDPSRKRHARDDKRLLSIMQRPTGVTVISVLFLSAAIYLWTIGVVKLLAPEAISLMSGAHLMYGLELAGPYMAMLVGTGYALVGWGLFRVHNWARWAAMLVMVVAVASLVPRISMAELGVPVLWYGFQIALRAAVAWYLAQAPAAVDAFAGKTPAL